MKVSEELDACYGAAAADEIVSEPDFGEALIRLEELAKKVKNALRNVREAKTRLAIYGCPDTALALLDKAETELEGFVEEF